MSLRTWLRNGLIRGIGRLKRPVERSDGPIYRILSYHRILARQQVAFGHQLDRLQKKYHLVTPEEFRENKGRSDSINLLLTFDDGYLNWESQVLKELSARNLRAVFFVCPDFVGMNKDEAGSYCRKHLKLKPALPLTTGGIDEILREGHTLGNHLVRHTDLRSTAEEETVRSVLEESRSLFESRFDRTAEWLAYPFGDYFQAPGIVRNCVGDFYEVAVTLIPGVNSADTDPLFLRRDAFSPDYSAPLEEAWLAGGYDPVFRLTHLTQRLP